MKGPNLSIVKKSTELYNNFPYDHYVIDDFLPKDLAKGISEEFFAFDDDRWYCYDNPLEKKRTIQDWGKFPNHTYWMFQYLCSKTFVDFLIDLTGIQDLVPDYGLHGGGWHMHGRGGNLNVHKDYSIHPKLGLQRKLNLIIYMTPDWDISWGGGLEMWSHDSERNKPLRLENTIECIYNRAVLFDTTQNSWHGLPTPITCPKDTYRKSLAIYYLTTPQDNTEERYRALYAPREEQEGNQNIINLIKKRSEA